MGSRGPAPAPLQLQQLKGVRPSRLRAGTPQPAVLTDLTPPKWFKITAEVRSLRSEDDLTEIVQEALKTHCTDRAVVVHKVSEY